MYFQAEETGLYYQVIGDGLAPIVMLHGTTGWGDSFRPIVPSLSKQHALFLPDLRGHGRSGHVKQGYRVLDFANDIIEFVETAVPAGAVLWGHSLGGLVGIAVAALRPDLVAALIVEDAPLWLRRFTVQTGSKRAYDYFHKLYELIGRTQNQSELSILLTQHAPEALARDGDTLPERLSRLDPDVLRMSYDSSLMDQFDLDMALGKIKCSTLIVQADPQEGGSLQDEDALAAIRLLADGAHYFVAGAGHIIHRDQPEQLAAFVEEWLRSR